eukprot:CAMPEP_0196997070 /NCGR_PEP_ID=MMETSP1380-20130617/2787_1 /TAXON_ID=5936 /ORGANISM="Euplotes crassus, Strain CT5" /LENGTH=315 /DNA_ID=CAMNT_0042413205 /DNA_START=37 /DNA_END=984 /DNA_ORIENTATION=+
MKSLLLLAIIVWSAYCAYNEKLAVDMVYASALSYCPSDKVMSGGCKAATVATENIDIIPIFSVSNNDSKLPIYMTLMKRESQKQIIVGFSGTKGADELIDEVTHILPKEYDIHQNKGVQVFEFFYNHYKDEFRNDFLKQMSDAVNKDENQNYDVIFTGHSLGGALTMHAAADAILSGLFTNNNVYIYTFGQPRVGNAEFIDEFIPKVKESYRVIHDNDIVPHLPPCITDFNDGCTKHGFLIPVFPYHAATEVLYEQGFESYKVCSTSEGEDKTCALSKSGKSIPDHLTYFGVEVGQFHTHESNQSQPLAIKNLMK